MDERDVYLCLYFNDWVRCPAIPERHREVVVLRAYYFDYVHVLGVDKLELGPTSYSFLQVSDWGMNFRFYLTDCRMFDSDRNKSL